MHILFSVLIVWYIIWLPEAHATDTGWLRPAENDHIEVRFRASKSIDITRVLVDVKLQPGWKTYWRSPGKGDTEPSIRWISNVSQIKWYWPAPVLFNNSAIFTQGYKGEFSFPAKVRTGESDNLAGILNLTSYLNSSVLTEIPFSLDLNIPQDVSFEADYARAKNRIPLSDGLIKELRASISNGELTITGMRDGPWQHPDIFFNSPSDVTFGKPETFINGNQFVTRIPVNEEGHNHHSYDLAGKGLDLIVTDMGLAQEISAPVKPQENRGTSSGGFWRVALLSIAGGLILMCASGTGH